jgi:CheY-like chemotaxis protein
MAREMMFGATPVSMSPVIATGKKSISVSRNEKRSLQASNSVMSEHGGRDSMDRKSSTHHSEGVVAPTFLEELQSRQRMLAAQSALGSIRRFLVVDDCPVSRKVVTHTLLKQGQEVVTAIDGIDCLRTYDDNLAEGKSFNVILMDYQMPLMNGKDAARELRARGFKNPIIGLTADIKDFGLAKTFIEYGADAVLPKPLNVAQLELELKDLADDVGDDDDLLNPQRHSPQGRFGDHRHSIHDAEIVSSQDN